MLVMMVRSKGRQLTYVRLKPSLLRRGLGQAFCPSLFYWPLVLLPSGLFECLRTGHVFRVKRFLLHPVMTVFVAWQAHVIASENPFLNFSVSERF